MSAPSAVAASTLVSASRRLASRVGNATSVDGSGFFASASTGDVCAMATLSFVRDSDMVRR
jgi:hypothetical protein